MDNAEAMKTVARYLGRDMKDVASGLRGIVTRASLQPTGVVVLSLQPEGDGKTKPDAHYVDIPRLDEQGEGIAKRASKPNKPKFRLGDRARRLGTGFEGEVVSITWHINGCVGYTLCPEHLNDKGETIYQGFLEDELEKAPAKSAKARPEPAKTGGPARGGAAVVR